jgi:hypothetical protein
MSMDVNEYFDRVQEYVKSNIQNPDELDSIIKEMEKDNLQAVINQDFNNVNNGDYEKAINDSGEKILKSAGIKGGVDMNEPVKLDGDRGLNTMERKVLNFIDFVNENKKVVNLKELHKKIDNLLDLQEHRDLTIKEKTELKRLKKQRDNHPEYGK